MTRQNSFTYEELLACANGDMFGAENAQLPKPPMLMFDRITKITDEGGAFNKGHMIAELDIKPDLWFFACHFKNDPVMPGCLGLDAMWQLLGFFQGWLGHKGKGRALGAGAVKFTGQIEPDSGLVTYELDIKRIIAQKFVMGIANGRVSIDNKPIYDAQDLRVGLFKVGQL